MAKRRSKGKPQLRIVFDTNVLFTGSASDFVRADVCDFVQSQSQHKDLDLQWYVPRVVIDERQYQMQQRGHDLLPAVQRLETLLGHNLNITGEIIDQRIEDAIRRQREALGLAVLEMDAERIDWHSLVDNASYRRAPFEPGDTEKGFRDAIILECFVQLVADSPSTPQVCRLILVTQDKLFGATVRERTSDHANVTVYETLEELKSLINTLGAAIDEEFVSQILEKSRVYFFVKGDEATLFFKENLGPRIAQQYKDELELLPPGATYRRNSTSLIGAPRFLKKQRQRVSWVTRISVESEGYTTKVTSSSVSGPAPGAGTASSLLDTLNAENLGSNVDYLFPQTAEELVANGKTVFEVTWSVSVTTKGALSRPNIESIEYIDTSWA